MPEQRPNDGGSYRRTKTGKYERLDQPQKEHPGTTVLRKQSKRRADDATNATPDTTPEAINPPAGEAGTKTGKAKE